MSTDTIAPAEETTASMIEAAFGEAEKIMVERGLTRDDVTSAFLTEGIDRLWTTEDREGLRAKVYAAASGYVDRLFDSLGDAEPREPSKYPEMDTPAFAAKAHAIIAKEERSFQAWLATADFDKLIDEAIVAGKEAYVNAPENLDARWTWATIDICHRRARPLVLALQRRGIGSLIASQLTYAVGPEEFTRETRIGLEASSVAIEAFALKLSAPGFEITIMHENEEQARAA